MKGLVREPIPARVGLRNLASPASRYMRAVSWIGKLRVETWNN